MRVPQTLRLILQPLAIAIGLAMAVRAAMHIYSIPSPSMAPTLQAGDQIIVTPYFGGDPQRGDVVVFRMNHRELAVKRVIGVPGDLIDSRLGYVRIGGHDLDEPYLLEPAKSGAIEAQIVAANCYFVMGDNRANSFDSRNWGLLPRERIVGRARMILWSSDSVASAEANALPASKQTAPRERDARIFKWIE